MSLLLLFQQLKVPTASGELHDAQGTKCCLYPFDLALVSFVVCCLLALRQHRLTAVFAGTDRIEAEVRTVRRSHLSRINHRICLLLLNHVLQL